MYHHFWLRIVCLAATLLYFPLVEATTDSVAASKKVVAEFYAAYFKTAKSGLPAQVERSTLLPYMSRHLAQALEQAAHNQATFEKEHPDEKPPLAEGDLFSSLFESPTRFSIASANPAKGLVRVMVRFEYVEGGTNQSKPIVWQDAVVVIQEGGRWVINDIEYLGEWAFKPGSRLTAVLSAQVQ